MKNRKFMAKLLSLSLLVSSTMAFSGTLFAGTIELQNTTVIGSSSMTTEESNISNETLVISAEGGKMQSADDNFNFSYIPVAGDFTATMRVSKLENIGSNARTYLMVRNGMDATSAHISAGLKGKGTGAFELRLPDRTSGSLSDAGINQYVRIVKEGMTYKIFVSKDLNFTDDAVKTFKESGSKNNTTALEANELNVGIAVCDAAATVDYFNIVDGSGNTLYDLQEGSSVDKPVEEATITNVVMPGNITVYENQSINLPSKVTAIFSDGTTRQVSVTWGDVTNAVGTHSVVGVVNGYAGTVTMQVTVLEKVNQGEDQPEQMTSVIYVAPGALDNGAGTVNAPMSLTKAIEKVEAGGTIYLKGGTYKLDHQLTIPYTNNGEVGKLKSMVALDGENVVLDFSVQAYDMKEPSNNERGIQLEGSYWYLKNITVEGAADNGFFIAGKHNTLELCVAKGNRDTGMQISRRASSVSNFEDWPSDNLILNCTSYNNSDPATGENADGFAAKLTCGSGNVFDGCISYNNVDDGWDLFAKPATGPIGAVTIRNCIAFRNGYTTEGTFTPNSDGNGFKLGGSKIAVSHIVENCIAFENRNHGFTDNSNPGTITVRNCTSINNAQDGGAKSNIDFARDKTNSYNILENCIAFSNGKVGSDKYKGEAKNCVFYNGGKWYEIGDRQEVDVNVSAMRGALITGPTANDFISLETPKLGSDVHTLWRNADGTINIGELFKIKSNSYFANRNLGADLSN